jgi:hypothetical protein
VRSASRRRFGKKRKPALQFLEILITEHGQRKGPTRLPTAVPLQARKVRRTQVEAPADHNEIFMTAMKGHFIATVWEDRARRHLSLENGHGHVQILVTSTGCEVVGRVVLSGKRESF